MLASLARTRKATAEHFIQYVIMVHTLVVEVFVGALGAFQPITIALL